MTIKLLVAIQGSGGVEIPAGTEVTLSDAVEAAHVSANKAMYTRTPARFDAPPSSGISAKYDPITRRIENTASGVSIPAQFGQTLLNTKLLGAMIDAFSVQAGNGASPGATVGSGAPWTWQFVLSSRVKPYAVRIGYLNPGTASYTVDKTVISGSSTLVLDGPPTGGTVANVLFSGVANVTVTGGGGADDNIAWSDWTPLTPIDRTDTVGAPYTFHIRSYISAGNCYYFGNASIANYPFNTQTGLARYCGQVAGDGTAFGAGNTYYSGNSLPIVVEFMSNEKCLRIAGVGDSRFASGSASDCGRYFYNMADQVATAYNAAGGTQYAKYATAYNFGWGSQTFAQICARIPGILTNIKPDVILLPTGSPNNIMSNQADYNTNMYLFLNAMRLCRESGVAVVAVTDFARNSLTAVQDNYRKQMISAVKAMAARGQVIVADTDALLSTSESPAKINSAYDIGDGLHINRAGIDGSAAIIAQSILT